MKTALVQDWLVVDGGAEKVFKAIYEIYPSPIYTLVADKENFPWVENKQVKESFIAKLPFAKKRYRIYLPFFPLAIEQLNLFDYDLIISSSYSVAKGILKHSEQLHICYMHSPVRYAWDLYFQYLKEANLERGLKGILAKYILHKIRIWDIISSNRVDFFVANSKFIAKRIKNVYRREAEVIYPPVDIDRFKLTEKKENYYITASRMVPYKKIDLIVKAFKKLPDKKLIVIGDGPDYPKIKKIAAGAKNIELLGYVEDKFLIEYISKAKAFVFAALEDFGIVPVEAQATGTPVIALGKGGTLETVIDKKTGILFKEQTVDSLINAIIEFEKIEDKFDYKYISEHANYFSKERFKKEFQAFVERKYLEFKN